MAVEQHQHRYPTTMNLLDRGMVALLTKHEQEVAILKAQRNELLKVCKALVGSFGHYGTDYGSSESDIKLFKRARAAIAAVEKEGK